MLKIKIFLLLAFTSILFSCNNTQVSNNNQPEAEPTSISPNNSTKVVLASEVNWTSLNPARGDQSPQAGTLWGDRSKEVATGFLVKFVDGFSSPPHIHNVTYRGVVIKGLIHNDDPNAEKMWMPAGSFWTQPAGEAHITAAKGSINMAFIEIENGPYLVHPTEQAFDNGERPVNIDKSNIVWVNLLDKTASSNNVKVAYLWGNPQANEDRGMMVKLPAGFTGTINSQGSSFRAVVIEGQVNYQMPNKTDTKILESGSFFSSEGKSSHQISSNVSEESVLYVRTDGKFDVFATE